MEPLTDEDLESIEARDELLARAAAEIRALRETVAISHSATNIVSMLCGPRFPECTWSDPSALPSNLWRVHVPEDVRGIWGQLSDEGRGVAYLVARRGGARERYVSPPGAWTASQIGTNSTVETPERFGALLTAVPLPKVQAAREKRGVMASSPSIS